MKSTLTSVVLSAGLALTAAGCAADPSVEQSQSAKPAVSQDQQHIASTTLALEKAFDVQFVKGHVDADALQPLINDVLQSMPDDMRADTKTHIYDVIAKGQQAASEMTPEQRAQMAAPVAADKLGPQQVDIIGAWGWGWPAFGGAGYGLGYGGLGWGGGYGTAVSTTTTAIGYGVPFGVGWGGAWGVPFGAVGWGAGWVPGWGAAGWMPGLGMGWGLGFGGLGAFGFPACGMGWGAGLGFGGAGLGFGAAGLGWGGAGLGLGVGVPGGWGF